MTLDFDWSSVGTPVDSASGDWSSVALPVGKPSKQNKGVAGDTITDLKRGIQQIPGIVTGLADIPIAAITGDTYADKAANVLGDITGFQPSKWAKDAEAEYSPKRRASSMAVDKAWQDNESPFSDAVDGDFSGIGNIAKAYAQNPLHTLGAVVESLPSMAAGGIAGRAAMGIGANAVSKAAGSVGPELPGLLARTVGEKVAPVIAGAAGEGAVMTGQQMTQLTEAGADPRTSAAASLATGIVGGGIGAMGGKLAQTMGIVDPETVLAGGAVRGVAAEAGDQSIKGMVKEGAKRVAGGAMSEGFFEELPQSVLEQTLSNLAQGKPWDEGVSRAAVEGTLAGSLMVGAFNVLPPSVQAPGQQPPANQNQNPLPALPAPTYTGTPGDQIIAADAERQAAIDKAQAEADALYAARDAFEREQRRGFPGGVPTITNDPAPIQQRIDALLGINQARLTGIARSNYEKALEAAFNERIGFAVGKDSMEIPVTMGDYLASKVAAGDIDRNSELGQRIALRQMAGQNATNRLQQLADEELMQQPDIAPDPIPVVGPISAAANVAVQTGVSAVSQAQQIAEQVAQQEKPAEQQQETINPLTAAMQQGGISAAVPEQVAAQAPQTNDAQVASFDVSKRTDKQLEYLTQHGQPGWKEAAAAELQKRGVQASAPQQAKTDTLSTEKPANSESTVALNDQNSVDRYAGIDEGFRQNREAMKGFKVGDTVSWTAKGTFTQKDGTKVVDPIRTGKITAVQDKDQGIFQIDGNISHGARFLTKQNSETNTNGDGATSQPPKQQASAPTEEQKPKKPLSVGVMPGAAEPITVKDGVVYIGKYPAQNFDTGEDVTVPAGATDKQVVTALKDAGAIAGKMRVFGMEKEDVKDAIGWTSMTTVEREGLLRRAGYGGANMKLNLAGTRIARTAWDAMSPAVRDKLTAAYENQFKPADQNQIKNENPSAATGPAETKAPEQDPIKNIDAAANEAATSAKNDTPQPTEAQQEAGNYKKGHITVHGLNITIENPEGSKRSGTDEDGKAWEATMAAHYGYIKRTEGNDGDHVDVYVGNDPESDIAFIVDQSNADGSFDEHKVLLGFPNALSATRAYAKSYEPGWMASRVIAAEKLTVSELKDWLKNGDMSKPYSSKKADQPNAETVTAPEKSEASPVSRPKTDAAPEAKQDKAPAIDFEKTFSALGFKKVSQNTYAMSVPTDNGSALFNIKHAGDPVTFAVTKSVTFDNGVTGAPTQHIGRYFTIEDAVEAARASMPAKSEMASGSRSANSEPETDAYNAIRNELSKSWEDKHKDALGNPLPDTDQRFAKNTIFTADKVAAARARMKAKLGTMNSGIDPELLIDGMTIAGAYIESGVRKFGDYAKAMVADLGEGVKPYLLSFYEAARAYPGLEKSGMDTQESAGKQHQELLAQKQKEQSAGIETAEGKHAVAKELADFFIGGGEFKTIIEARKKIAEMIGKPIDPATELAKQADETIEAAVVIAGREMVATGRKQGRSSQVIYDRLVSLYQAQPNLAVRSSTSVRDQAYSTPVPLAYLASELAGITAETKVLEPTAGNGMLLVGANVNNAVANELNPKRAAMLEAIGFKTTTENAATSELAPAKSRDAVIANPPFGATKDANGDTIIYSVNPNWDTREVDHAIAFMALDAMKDDGRAVLIVGGSNANSEEGRREDYRGKNKRQFYFNLYNDYNVVDHFTVDGDLYSKQGASYPVDVIVIDGRGKSSRDLPAADLPKVFTSYEALKEKLNDANRMDAGRRISSRVGGGDAAAREGDAQAVAGRPGGQSDRNGTEGGAQRNSASLPDARLAGNAESAGGGGVSGNRKSQSANKPGASNGERVSDAGGKAEDGSAAGNQGDAADGLGGVSVVDGQRVESGLADRRGQEQETENQVAYTPQSGGSSVGTLVPRAMRDSIESSLQRIADQVGNIDEYVAESLDMDPETVRSNFSAEQIDALALSIRNAEAGKGFIIGDQTGIGKGRVVAAMIRYALVNGKVPIFVTEKPNLYSDMIRDLDDIGMTDDLALDTKSPKILITNGSETIPYTLLRNVDGEIVENNLSLKSPKSGKALDDLMRSMVNGDSLGDYRVIFTTYSQLQTVKGNETTRQKFIKHFGESNYMIFDESHNAGGAGEQQARTKEQRQAAKEGQSLVTGRAAFVRNLVQKAFGTFFSSATYAKRPDVMDLYSSTNMKLAVDRISQLGEAIKSGGVPMQQAVANMLTKDGQYIRRERTFAGVAYDTVETTVDKQTAENMANSMRAILAFSRQKDAVIKSMQKEFDRQGAMLAAVGGETTSVQGANFGSIMHNLIDQMLLSLKAKSSVDHAISRLKAGEKVVMTVSNTMGSFLQSYAEDLGLATGDPVALSFADLYERYLEKQRIVSIKTGGGEKKQHRLTDAELGPELVGMYESVRKQIRDSGFGSAPISPIDYMHSELRKAGYKTDEITGRTMVLKYGDNGAPVLTSRSANIKQRVGAVSAFNNGSIDVLILNQAGSTGLSLHASSKVKDQRKRHMIIVQAEKNIDTHMQMLGRVHRTGQVIAPAYSQMMADVPAEMRPASVLLKKMASLNANTTASRKSSVTAEGVVDFMNDYGGQIVHEYLRDNPEVLEAVGGPDVLKLTDDSADGNEDDIRKFTGYIPILPIKQQEEIYRELTERYNDLIERENSLGTNKLEAKAVDLDAETISSLPISESKGEQSVFADQAFMEKVDVKRSVKPYSSQEVAEIIMARLEGSAASLVASEQISDLRKRAVEFAREKVAKMQADGVDPVKIHLVENQITATNNHAHTILNSLRIGDTVSIKDSAGQFMYGAITNISTTGKAANPAAGSAWKMTFALANGDAKSITLNFSQIGSKYEVRSVANADWYNIETQQAERVPVMSLFDKGATVRREKRWMVTGNILAGFSRFPGQIITYTKKDGSSAQGILMSRQFDFEKEMKNAPVTIRSGSDAIRALDGAGSGTIIGSRDKMFQITHRGNRYEVTAPSSKKDGGTYYLDSGITDIVGDFYKRGSVMSATVYERSQVERLVDYLNNERQEAVIAINNTERAKELLGQGGAKVSGNIADGQASLSPADKAVYGMVAEGKSATDILKFIASGSRNPFYRQLAKLLLKTGIAPKAMAGTAQGWKFNAGNDKKYAAAYNEKTDTIALFRPAAAERNFLHEAIHAATIRALGRKGMAAGQMKALFAHVQKTGKLKGMYGMSDVDEFIAEAFSNPKFQDALKKVAAPKASGALSSAWHWFVRIVKGILGLPANQESALSQALEIGLGVMRENMALGGDYSQPARGVILANDVRQDSTINRSIDGARLQALRRAAARIERPEAGVTLYITNDGRAITSGPNGARIPDRYRRFAEENNLTFEARRLPTGSGVYSPAMPVSYRESGAKYFGDLLTSENPIDRTDKTRYNVADEGWSVADPSKMDDVIYALQDKQIDMKRVVQAIKSAGNKIRDNFNPYLQEELFHGRAAKGVKGFLDFELRPLLKDMQERGVDMGDFEEYLWNRHAEERNKQIAKINPDMPDGGSGIATAEARAYLAGLSAEQKAKYEALAKRVDAMNRGSQKVLVESGLESSETIAAWNGAYQSYVPLQREDVDSGHVGTGKGFSIRGSSSKRAMGSGKKVVDIIANIAMQRERNIVRAEKNRVSNALLGLAMENPNPDFWKVDQAPKERVVNNVAIYNVLDADGNKVADFTNMAEAEHMARSLGGDIEQTWGDRVQERIEPGFKNRDNVVLTRVNGKDHYIIFNERDERAMRMAQSLKNLDVDNMGRVLSVVGKATRYLASVNTQYNPVFGVINLIRDAQGALVNLTSTPLAGDQKKVLGYTVDALRGIYADIRAHRRGEKPSSNWANLFEEFQKEGGQTGYRDQYANAEARAEAIESEIEQFKEGKAKQLTRGIFGWLSDYNETMENAVRLAAYKAGKERGLSNQQAASVAKNITVNFNRKGQMATQVGALYAFFNASVQGTARIAETLFEQHGGDLKSVRLSRKGRQIVTGGLLLGSMQALLLAAAGYGDDEPPDFVRERNLILPIGDGKYLTLAMPLGFHVIPGTGRIATEFVMSGFKDPLKRMAQFGSTFAEAFNPVGNSGFSLQTITPSVVDPFAALAENKDFTGKEIYRENFNSLNPQPGHARAKDTATIWSKVISEGINTLTGGTEFKPGLVSPSPDAIDYLIGQATGGVGRELSKAFQTAESSVTGEELPIYKVPLVGRFVGDIKGQAGESAKFYEAIKQINMHEAEYKGLIKAGRRDEAAEYLAENPQVKLMLAGNSAETQVRKLRTAKRELLESGADPVQVSAIEEKITGAMRAFNERVGNFERLSEGKVGQMQ